MTKINPIQNASTPPLGFDAALEAAKDGVDGALASSPVLIRGYTRHLMVSRGKFIRAASLLTCAQDGEGLIHPNAARLAAAVELLHLATLVHDDVIDDAGTRRGEITLQKKYGRRAAVICGDYLLCAALQMAASISNRRDYADFEFSGCVGRLCLGELEQHINNGNLDLSIYRYLKIIRGKTAALFEASFYAGAIHCTGDERELRRYTRLGRYIGMIFQLTDDCIDFEQDETSARKPVQSDYEQGVITLPLIHALESEPQFRDRARGAAVSRAELNRAVARTGGLDFTYLVSRRYYDKALRLIAELAPPAEKGARLRELLDRAYFGLKKRTGAACG